LLIPPDNIVLLLAEAPNKIEAATSAHPDDWLAQRSTQADWSPNEILAHLRACQDMWGDIRVIRMLQEDQPTMRAVNPNTWLNETDYYEISFTASLTAFTHQRARFVQRLREISTEAWNRAATFTGGGKPRVYTVHTEADALARHERSHIKQIEKLCGRQRPITN